MLGALQLLLLPYRPGVAVVQHFIDAAGFAGKAGAGGDGHDGLRSIDCCDIRMNALFNRKAKQFQESFWGGVDMPPPHLEFNRPGKCDRRPRAFPR